MDILLATNRRPGIAGQVVADLKLPPVGALPGQLHPLRLAQPGNRIGGYRCRRPLCWERIGLDCAAMPAPVVPHPTLSTEALEAIYAHARRDYPNECCGIAYGPRDQPVVDRATPCENIQNRLHAEDPVRFTRDARTAYNLEARDIFALQKSLRGDSPAKIVYHSHCDVGAYFSDTDQAAAQFDGEPSYPVEYVVVDVRVDGTRGAKQFAWDDEQKKYVEVGAYA